MPCFAQGELEERIISMIMALDTSLSGEQIQRMISEHTLVAIDCRSLEQGGCGGVFHIDRNTRPPEQVTCTCGCTFVLSAVDVHTTF